MARKALMQWHTKGGPGEDWGKPHPAVVLEDAVVLAAIDKDGFACVEVHLDGKVIADAFRGTGKDAKKKDAEKNPDYDGMVDVKRLSKAVRRAKASA